MMVENIFNRLKKEFGQRVETSANQKPVPFLLSKSALESKFPPHCTCLPLFLLLISLQLTIFCKCKGIYARIYIPESDVCTFSGG